MPRRVVPLLEDLSQDEYLDMWTLVRSVQNIIKHHHVGTTAFNVAIQDGVAAGQSVPHVHVHILPRKGGDFPRNDDIYDALEEWAPKEGMVKSKATIDVPNDEDRLDRTNEMMANEAATYKSTWESWSS
jgi:bis(5'-adenosyl)-triphosphatase